MDRAPTMQAFDSSELRHRPEHNGPDYDYKEIAREVLARIDQRLADLERDAPPQPAETPPGEDGAEASGKTAREAMSFADRAAFGRTALRGLSGLLTAAVVVAAAVWLWFHGDLARHVAAAWASRVAMGSTPSREKPQAAAEPGPLSSSSLLAAAAAMQAGPPLRAAADNDRPAPVPPELAELMRKVDRNVAGLAQAVNELRTALQQVSENNAKAVEEVRSSVDQLGRTVVRVEQAEQAVQPRSSPPAAAPRAAAPAQRTRRYAPVYNSPYDAQAQFLR